MVCKDAVIGSFWCCIAVGELHYTNTCICIWRSSGINDINSSTLFFALLHSARCGRGGGGEDSLSQVGFCKKKRLWGKVVGLPTQPDPFSHGAYSHTAWCALIRSCLLISSICLIPQRTLLRCMGHAKAKFSNTLKTGWMLKQRILLTYCILDKLKLWHSKLLFFSNNLKQFSLRPVTLYIPRGSTQILLFFWKKIMFLIPTHYHILIDSIFSLAPALFVLTLKIIHRIFLPYCALIN